MTSCAFWVEDQAAAEAQGWMALGLRHSFEGYVDHGRYHPSDEIILNGDDEVRGLPLVLESEEGGEAGAEWYLHQDFVLSLRLRREGDTWVAPREGYQVAARLTRNEEGCPVSLEVVRDYLLDHLTAWEMGLWLLTFRERRLVTETAPTLLWPDGEVKVTRSPHDVFEGWFYSIHEGNGMRFGEQMAVFHASRTDVDPDDKVPYLGSPMNNNVMDRLQKTGAERDSLLPPGHQDLRYLASLSTGQLDQAAPSAGKG